MSDPVASESEPSVRPEVSPDAAQFVDAGAPDAKTGAGGESGGGGTGGSSAVDANTPHVPSAHCGTRPCACDDGVDNDRDGTVDGLDPECTGAYDDDEATFGIGKPNKQNQCRDCFWDDNAGFDEGCRYPAECLAGTTPNGRGNCSSCQVSQNCIDSCQGRTPNGCDCFGCCEVKKGSGRVFIELGQSCDLSQIDDPVACPPCIPSTQCANPCGRCELCLGKRTSDLPADCAASTPGGPTYTCDDHALNVCAASADCVGASYCLLGCCLIDLQ